MKEMTNKQVEQALIYANSFNRWDVFKSLSHHLTPRAYPKLLREALESSDASFDTFDYEYLFDVEDIRLLMSNTEYGEYLRLPETFTIYRGFRSWLINEFENGKAPAFKDYDEVLKYVINPDSGCFNGMFWTLNINVAYFFAYVFGRRFKAPGFIAETTIHKSVAWAYWNDRQEETILINPEDIDSDNVKILSMEVEPIDYQIWKELGNEI